MAERQVAVVEARPRGQVLPYLLLALVMLFWSSNWIVGRGLRDAASPMAINFWRWSIAAVLLLPFSWPQLRQSWPVIRRHWSLMLLFGITGAGAFHSLIYTGLAHTEAINGVLLNSSLPVIVVIISWIWYRESITWRQALGIAISFLGIFTIIGRGDPANLLHLSINYGDALILLAMPIWSFYSVLLRKRPAGIGDLAFLQVLSFAAVASVLPLYLWELGHGGRFEVGVTTVSCMVYIAVTASLLGYIFFNWAVAELGPIGPNVAGFSTHLMPAYGSILAILILHEQAYPYHAAGIALILAGVFLSTCRRGKR